MSYLSHDGDIRFWVALHTSRTLMKLLRRELEGIPDPPREELVYRVATAVCGVGLVADE